MADVQGTMRWAGLLMWVIWHLPELIVYQPHSSTLEQIKDKLQGMLGHIDAVGYTENGKDVQTVSELMDDIRDAITAMMDRARHAMILPQQICFYCYPTLEEGARQSVSQKPALGDERTRRAYFDGLRSSHGRQ